jgi:signal transduction histidine kinase/CheY-like chemotaxis protein
VTKPQPTWCCRARVASGEQENLAMQPAPLPLSEPERLAALSRYQVLDTGPEPSFDDLTRLASQLCDTPIALVSLIDAERQWFKSRVGLDATETPRDLAFCAHAILDKDEVMVVPDARLDSRFADNPLVEGPPNVRFYAGVPLVESDGHALGTLCVIDTVARELSDDQRDALRILGRQVVSQLELHRRNRELRASERLAQRAAESRASFMVNMSREIRTPLGAVLGFSELLSEAPDLPPGARELVKTIARNGRHLGALVGDVLDLSKIESGQLRVTSSLVDLRELVEEQVELQRSHAEAKGLELSISYGTSVPATIVCDRSRLRQILRNLIDNAVKATEQGRVQVLLRGVRGADSQPVLECEVRDTGAGIDSERLTAIFEPFRTAEPGRSARFGGTGLGLTVSRQLAEAMGGKLEVRSTPGAGSSFILKLPMRALEEATGDLESGSAPPSTSRLESARVLVVDDMPDNRLLVRHMLGRVGADVRCAASGTIALQMLKKSPDVDVVLMDLSMPVLDGYETLSLLRARGFDRPVVALTASASADDREACMAAGFDAYLTRPIDRSALEATLENLLGDDSNERLAA